MRRDLELWREILLKVEASDGPIPLQQLVESSHTLAEIGYQVKLTQDARLR
jgi:hypothetical protein